MTKKSGETMSQTFTENRTVTSIEARKAILKAFAKKRPIFLWGPMGIGKSELMQGIVDSGDLGNALLIDLRMALMEPTDIKGIPFYNKELGLMDWAPPVDLPTEELAKQYDTIVLFMDELNSAPQSTQAASYQLVLNGKVGNYVLPKNVVIVAAGNRETDKGVTYRMPAPLANRFVHLEMRVDYDAWLQWAIDNEISSDVIGHITVHKQDLFDFDARSSSRSFATPRSWTFVSQLLDDEEMDEETLANLVCGAVGEGVGVKFMATMKNSGKLPNPTDVLNGKVKKLDNSVEISGRYSLTVSMCYELREAYEKNGSKDIEGFHKLADNFFRFMMDNFETEMVVLGARAALVTYKIPLRPKYLKNYKEFYDRFGKYIKASHNA
jgi:hypothetical protein